MGFESRGNKIWMDGKLVDWTSANVHVLTHGLHYASSVFEGTRFYNGKIFKFFSSISTTAVVSIF